MGLAKTGNVVVDYHFCVDALVLHAVCHTQTTLNQHHQSFSLLNWRFIQDIRKQIMQF